MASANGVTYRNYEAAVASIFTKYADVAADDCPLSHFPPRVSKLPPLPDDPTLSEITSGIPAAIPIDEDGHQKSSTAAVKNDQISKKCTGRLARKRLAKKHRAEAERGDQPPCWPFNVLPPAACPRSGGRLSGRRAWKKEGQLSSMIRCVLAMLPGDAFGPALEDERDTSISKVRIVDFAGGSGHLGLPLALLLPRCEVVIVDLKERSLDVARERAAACGLVEPTCNLKTSLGSITKYREPFDIGLALHACGEATDLALRACGEANAAFVTASCCVGKLQIAGLNPYVYQANNNNAPEVDYPQSGFYRNCLGLSSDKFDALAKAADHAEDGSESTNPIKRTAKLFLEADRLAYAAETCGYNRNNIALTRMEPLDSSPKNDILMGWFSSNRKLKSPYLDVFSVSTSADPSVVEAERQLSSLIDNPSSDQRKPKTNEKSAEQTLRIDWTHEEEEEIRSNLQCLLNESEEHNETYRFPTGMGSRKRRLIHFVADDMGLAHWGEGKKGSDKTVCVAKQRPRNSPTDIK